MVLSTFTTATSVLNNYSLLPFGLPIYHRPSLIAATPPHPLPHHLLFALWFLPSFEIFFPLDFRVSFLCHILGTIKHFCLSTLYFTALLFHLSPSLPLQHPRCLLFLLSAPPAVHGFREGYRIFLVSVSMFPRTLLALIPLLGLLSFLCCFRRTLLFLARRFLALFKTIR